MKCQSCGSLAIHTSPSDINKYRCFKCGHEWLKDEEDRYSFDEINDEQYIIEKPARCCRGKR